MFLYPDGESCLGICFGETLKILFLGDNHLRINKFVLATQYLSWIDELIQEQRPDLVVNLGDALDTHAVIRSEVLNELMSHIYRCIDSGIPYVYLKGNHDQFSPKDSKYHALLPFRDRIKDLFVVDEVRDLFGMTFVPFLPNGEDFPKETLPICVAHQTFLGADYGPVNALEGVDAETVSAEIIISGHIHKKHTLGKVHYVGSPYSQDASDVGQIKGVHLFDTNTYKFEFFKCPLPTWKSYKFEFDGNNTAEQLHYDLQQNLTGNDHWVIEIKGPKAEVTAYVDSKDFLSLVKNQSIRLKTVFTDKQKQKVSISAVSMEQIVSDFVNKVYTGSLSRDLILTKAKAVLEEVRNESRTKN